jgi:hypothetical protein
MLCLPPGPQYKLLTGRVYNFVGIDLASGPNMVRVAECWFKDGRYQMFVNGELVEDSHYHVRPPWEELPWH